MRDELLNCEIFDTVTENTEFGFDTITPGSSTYIKIFNNIDSVDNYEFKVYNYCNFSSLEDFLESDSDDWEDYLVYEDTWSSLSVEEYNMSLDDVVYVAILYVSSASGGEFYGARKDESFYYKNSLLDLLNINKIIAGFFSPVNNYLPKSKGFK